MHLAALPIPDSACAWQTSAGPEGCCSCALGLVRGRQLLPAATPTGCAECRVTTQGPVWAALLSRAGRTTGKPRARPSIADGRWGLPVLGWPS